MPFYSYECGSCHTKVEYMRPFAEMRDKVSCTHCEGTCYLAVSLPMQSIVKGASNAGREAYKPR